MKTGNQTKTQTRWWEPVTALFLLLALSMMTGRLVSTHWIDHLNIIPIIMVFGYLAGLALGQSRFSTKTVIWFTLCYGLFIVLWQIGTTLDLDIAWSERLLNIWLRLSDSFVKFIRQEDVRDPLLFLTSMACLYWSISLHAGFAFTRRGNPWEATIPACVVTFIMHLSDIYWSERVWYLLIFLILAMLIVARLNYLHLNVTWQQNRARIPSYISWDLSRTALLIAIPLVLIAWAAPATIEAIPNAQRQWTTFSKPIKEKFDHLFASLQASVGLVADTYGESLNMSTGIKLSDDIFFFIEAPAQPPPGIRYYWRSRVYDYYMDGRWNITDTTTLSISPGIFDTNLAPPENQWLAEFSFMPQVATRTIITAPQPTYINRPGKIQVINNPGNVSDIVAIIAEPYLRPGDVYKIQSSLTNITIARLRAAPNEYPDWITKRYLQLPESITPRTRDLAQQITAGVKTNYDKVDAITNYLRANIDYQEVIDSPPGNHERLDWLLFDYKKGFCQYYASAEVILLRILGIPARMAVGYAQGEHKGISKSGENQPGSMTEMTTYIVRYKDAHAWPEVFFAGIGWVIFEPTANQNPLEHPSGEVSPGAGTSQGNQAGMDDLLPPERHIPSLERDNVRPESTLQHRQNILSNPIVQITSVFLAVILISLAVSPVGQKFLLISFPLQLQAGLIRLGVQPPQALERWVVQVTTHPPQPRPLIIRIANGLKRLGIKPPKFLEQWVRFTTLPPLTRAYQEINKALARLGTPPSPSATPAERASSLIQLLPETEEAVEYLIYEYQAGIYSQEPSLPGDVQSAGKEIRRKSTIVWIRKLINQIKMRFSRFSLH
jgi:transglutaminase-like putative cysteine protease